jgi:hypothetical protein
MEFALPVLVSVAQFDQWAGSINFFYEMGNQQENLM